MLSLLKGKWSICQRNRAGWLGHQWWNEGNPEWSRKGQWVIYKMWHVTFWTCWSKLLFPERSAKTIEMAGFLCYGKVLLVMINVAVGWSPLQPLKNFTSFYINGRTVWLVVWPQYVSKPKVLVRALLNTWMTDQGGELWK